MKEKSTKKIVRIFINVAGCLALLCAGLIAQEPADSKKNEAQPTTPVTEAAETDNSDTKEAEKTTSAATTKKKKDNETGYDVQTSFEFGARGRDVDGNVEKYRSDLNYKAGIRFFDSTVRVTADDTDGKPFDSLLFTTTGWNADPNGFMRINFEKLGVYDFKSTIRRFRYFNNLLNFARNQHNRNTEHKMGDFDLTLLPQNDVINIRLGYSFDTNSGPQLTTYDFDRDEFPVSSDYDTNAHDFRAGVDLTVAGVALSFTEGYRKFREDTRFSIDTLALGNNPNPFSSISTLSRFLPTDGKTNYHRFTFHKNFDKKVDVTGRLIYSETKTDFTFNQLLTGTDRFGNSIISDELIGSGEGKRPNTFGDIGVTFFATDKIRISNTFGFHSYRITGSNSIDESVISVSGGGMALPPIFATEGIYRFTRFRRFRNTLEGDFDVNRYLSFFAGYRYSDRDVDLTGTDTQSTGMSSSISMFTESADNTAHTIFGGVTARPIPKKWTIYFNIESGESDNAFTRVSNYDTLKIKFRNRFTISNELSANFSFEYMDNDNPSRPDAQVPQILAARTTGQIFSGSVNYMPNEKVTLNGGYTYNHLDTDADVRFPSFGPPNIGRSEYRLRSNFGYFNAWFKPHNRVSVFGAYRITKDTGSGDFFSSSNSLIFGNYPLQYQSPEFRVIFKIANRVDWNIGYQYYDYSEKVLSNQDYKAHLPYTSIRIYLGKTKDR